MADATTIKGGKFRVLLDLARNGTYAAPCGFLSKSMTLTKGLEEFTIPTCDDPDAISWLGRDANTLSMAVSGEGVAAEQSIEVWLDAIEDPDSVPAKVEMEFPSKSITWTGLMHISTFTAGHPTERGRVTSNVEMASDGKMTRVVA